jgi:CheY-like chemotaxis protein
LVVDDEDFVRSLIVDVLANLGHQVEAASNGTEALRRCEQMRYDLIVSDLRMPKMDGAALYQALRDKYGSAMPRMIFVTGQAHSLDYAGFLGIAGVPVLAKPLYRRWSPEGSQTNARHGRVNDGLNDTNTAGGVETRAYCRAHFGGGTRAFSHGRAGG